LSLIVVFFWGVAQAALSCLFTAAKPDFTRIALQAGTGVYGFFYVRHINFFMIAAFLSAERARE
jgi:hypothetical protein